MLSKNRNFIAHIVERLVGEVCCFCVCEVFLVFRLLSFLFCLAIIHRVEVEEEGKLLICLGNAWLRLITTTASNNNNAYAIDVQNEFVYTIKNNLICNNRTSQRGFDGFNTFVSSLFHGALQYILVTFRFERFSIVSFSSRKVK